MIKIVFIGALILAASTDSYQAKSNRIGGIIVETRVSFARNSFSLEKKFTVAKNAFTLRCMSLSDELREKFAETYGSDPVADFSCYVRDERMPRVYTILAESGEGLQFSPAFFWKSEVASCRGRSLVLVARASGIRLKMVLSGYRPADSTAILTASAIPDASANGLFTESSYSKKCAAK